MTDSIPAILAMTGPLLFAALGAIVSEHAGVLAVFMDGAITLAGFICIAVTAATGNALAGALAATAGTVLILAIIAIFNEKTGANPFITGLAVNLLAAGLTSWLSVLLFGTRGVVALPVRAFSAGAAHTLSRRPYRCTPVSGRARRQLRSPPYRVRDSTCARPALRLGRPFCPRASIPPGIASRVLVHRRLLRVLRGDRARARNRRLGSEPQRWPRMDRPCGLLSRIPQSNRLRRGLPSFFRRRMVGKFDPGLKRHPLDRHTRLPVFFGPACVRPDPAEKILISAKKSNAYIHCIIKKGPEAAMEAQGEIDLARIFNPASRISVIDECFQIASNWLTAEKNG